jgi:ribosomal protein L29
MKATEELKTLRGMDEKDLAKELEETNLKLAKDVLSIRAGKSDKTDLVSKLRKKIARLESIMSEKGRNNG